MPRISPVTIKRLNENGEREAVATVVPSPADIKKAQTKNGGWTKATLAMWGVSWPPPKGWRRELEERWKAYQV